MLKVQDYSLLAAKYIRSEQQKAEYQWTTPKNCTALLPLAITKDKSWDQGLHNFQLIIPDQKKVSCTNEKKDT
jgi:hypothetical protein